MGFFDKLKGVEKNEPAPEVSKEKIKRKKEGKSKSGKLKIRPTVTKAEEEITQKEEKPAEVKIIEKSKKEEPDFEGELAIDVYETDNDFIIQSTIAGVKAEDLDITIENDIVTIRGSREKQVTQDTKKHYYQECYWGAFSRQVILPEEVDGSGAQATMKDGVLTLRIPKTIKVQKHKIKVV